MFKKRTPRFETTLGTRKAQGGAALIVALVVLAAVTLIGVSNMQSSNFEMKMTASAIERSKSFAIVDNALNAIEANVAGGALFDRRDLYTDACVATGRCFTPDCDAGFCFEGSFDTTMGVAACEVAPSDSSIPRKVFWEDDGWDDDTKHRTLAVGAAEVKYIIEFLCFVDDGSGVLYTDPAAAITAYPLFRITARYEGQNGRSPVMLQTTYSLPI